MSDELPKLHRDLLAASAAAVATTAAAAEAAGRADGPGPAAGDLFVLRETAGFAVEWLVVEIDREEPARCLVVPADTNPLLGAGDLAVAGGSPSGALSVRCGCRLWLPAAVLDPDLRTGCLAPRELAPVARRCRLEAPAGGASAHEIAAPCETPGNPETSESAESGDLGDIAAVDPEYRDWIEGEIAPARAALAAALLEGNEARNAPRQAGVAPVTEREPREPGRPSPGGGGGGPWWRRWRRRAVLRRPMSAGSRGLGRTGRTGEVGRRGLPGGLPAIAAVAAVVVALGLSAEIVRQARTIGRLRAERDAATRQLQHHAVDHASDSPDPSPREPDVIPDLPLVTLQAETLRGAPDRVSLDPARQGLLVVAIEPPGGPAAAFPAYRLEVRDLRSGRRVWSGGDLHLDPATGLVKIGIRQHLLPPGLYGFRLDGVVPGGRGHRERESPGNSRTAGRVAGAGRYTLEITSTVDAGAPTP